MIKWTTCLSFSLLLLMVSHLAVAGEDKPKEVVSSTIQSIINVLEMRVDKTRITDANREDIRKVIVGKFDYFEMSRRSVGKPWKSMGMEDKAVFSDVFRQMLEYSYGNQLASYHGQKVVFQDADFKKNKARVKGEVIDGNISIPMEYRLHQTDTGWQVYDIKIEGVSMITTFKKDFKSILRKQGVDGLLATLQKKVKKLKEKS